MMLKSVISVEYKIGKQSSTLDTLGKSVNTWSPESDTHIMKHTSVTSSKLVKPQSEHREPILHKLKLTFFQGWPTARSELQPNKLCSFMVKMSEMTSSW